MFVSHPAPVAPWSLVNSTYGVSRLVKFGDRPAQVPHSIISELRAACNDAGIIATAPQVFVGALVEVTSGAFTNFVGYVERLAPEQRAMVLLDIIGKHTKVTLPLTQLRVASGRTKQSRSD
jgi:transcriptional antiterminator RfaH